MNSWFKEAEPVAVVVLLPQQVSDNTPWDRKRQDGAIAVAPLPPTRFLRCPAWPRKPGGQTVLQRGRQRSWLASALEAFANLVVVAPLLIALGMLALVPPALAAPGLCVGPVCGDDFSRSAQYHWQLRLRVNDQQGHRERLVVDCRSGEISPRQGLVERGYAGAVARRACRLAGEQPG